MQVPLEAQTSGLGCQLSFSQTDIGATLVNVVAPHDPHQRASIAGRVRRVEHLSVLHEFDTGQRLGSGDAGPKVRGFVLRRREFPSHGLAVGAEFHQRPLIAGDAERPALVEAVPNGVAGPVVGKHPGNRIRHGVDQTGVRVAEPDRVVVARRGCSQAQPGL